MLKKVNTSASIIERITKIIDGITVPKKTDTAVGRNKIKRRAKNIIDNNKNTIQNGYDYVIIVRKGILELTYKDMEKELLKLIKSIGD